MIMALQQLACNKWSGKQIREYSTLRENSEIRLSNNWNHWHHLSMLVEKLRPFRCQHQGKNEKPWHTRSETLTDTWRSFSACRLWMKKNLDMFPKS